MKRSLLSLAILFALSSAVFGQSHFRRGDVNGDGSVALGDVIASLNFQFLGGSIACRDAADINDDGSIGLPDVISVLNFLFLGGAAPAAPFPGWEADPTPDGLDCKPNIVDLGPGDLATQTLSNQNTYRLVGTAFVRAGSTLTIPAGTTIIGDNATQGLLVTDSSEAGVSPGNSGRLVCNGNESAPVVFTSEFTPGNRAAGDWGGLVMLGTAITNDPSGVQLAEGLGPNDTFGGATSPNNDESSGSLSYVRVEFGGTEISPNNEVNSISMFGIGAGTNFDHIQVKANLDDGFEWFGGSADLKFGLVSYIQDDCFDYSFGWTGRGQFWVAHQGAAPGEKGFECDNSENNQADVPLTIPTIGNVTLIAGPNQQSDAAGMNLRRGAGGRIFNAIVQGFTAFGAIDIDDAQTTINHPAGSDSLILGNSVLCNNLVDLILDGSEDARTMDFFMGTGESTAGTNTGGIAVDCVDAAPFTTNANLPVVAVRNMPAEDANGGDGSPFFDAVNFIGGVDNAAPWTNANWISYAEN